MKGGLHPSKNRSRKTDFGTLCLRSCFWVTVINKLFFSGVAIPETAMGITITITMRLPRGCRVIGPGGGGGG